jgi:hypothetical protein
MYALVLGTSLPRRTGRALLAVVLVVFMAVVMATPSHAAPAAINAGIQGSSSRLNAVLELRTVPRVMGANGALACVAGDYARATNRWTNACGQILAVGMYVGMNSACQVRFREHLVGSGSNGCNFDSDNATIWDSFGEPPNIPRASSKVLGHTNYEARLNDGDCDWWYTGTWHDADRDWVMP